MTQKMKEKIQKIEEDVKGCVFNELVEKYDYWGENSLVEMIDFCKRNNLDIQKKVLTNLLRPNIIK